MLSIKLRDPLSHKTLTLVIDQGVTCAEIKNLVELSFGCPSLVGLYDSSSAVFYPTSLLLSAPSVFPKELEFDLVYGGGTSCTYLESVSPSDANYGTVSETLNLSEAIEEARYLIGNDCVNINEFVAIAGTIGENEMLTRENFHLCFKSFHRPGEYYQLSSDFKVRQKQFVDLVFDSLKYDTTSGSESVVGVRDVLSMLSVLCCHNLRENLSAVFCSYDTNSAGYISEYALLSHLYVVFCFLFKLSQNVRDKLFHMERIEGDPRRFARGVWKELMARNPSSATTHDGDGVLFVSDFILACESVINSGYGGLLFESSLSAAISGVDDILVDGEDEQRATLSERRAILGLKKYSATYVLEFFSDIASSDGVISESQFQQGINKLIMRHYNDISSRERSMADLIINSIFRLFDSTSTGFCDMLNLGAGLSVYCGGNSRDKSRALYTLVQRFAEYDINLVHGQPPMIPVNRMSTILSTIFKSAMMLDSECDGLALDDSTFDTLAAEIALGAMSQPAVEGASIRNITHVTQGEFESCLHSTFTQYFGDSLDSELIIKSLSPEKSLGANATLAVDTTHPDHVQFSSRVHRDTDVPGNLENSSVIKELRAARLELGLSGVPAEDLIEILGDWAYGGIISRPSFYSVMFQLSKKVGDKGQLQSLIERIFNLFESETEPDTADYVELIVGLCTLSTSSFQDKLLVSFMMLDSDEDGYISADDLNLLLLSTLRVVAACSNTAADKIRKCNVNLSDVASSMVAEAVENSETNQYFPTSRFSLEMIMHIAEDCIELAENVTSMSTTSSEPVV